MWVGKMSHLEFAVVSGALVAGLWAFLTPFSVGPIGHAGAGFVVGFSVYAVLAIMGET